MPTPRPTLDAILTCPSLPSLPTVAMQVLELTRAPAVQYQDIERVVQLDPALTAKILKTVNSSYYGLSKPCPTIGRALTYLGLNTVKSLVLGFSLVDVTRRSGASLDLVAYWQRSIFGAVVARRLAGHVAGCDPDEAFVAALMQDLGMLAIDRALEEHYAAVIQAAGPRHHDLTAAEREQLSFDHAQVGAALAERWRLPAPLVQAIRWHHGLGAPEAPPVPAVTITAFSCHLHESLATREAPPAALAEFARDAFALRPEDLAELVGAARTDAREIAAQFKVSVGELPDASLLMAQAEEAMVAHQVSMERQTQELSRQARIDGLTGAANRLCFDQELATEFEQARRRGGSLGLIIADADRFKKLNDTHGHQAGDAVLVELARRMRAVVGEAGLVCRYGGEEFAIILPGATRQSTAQKAEALRHAVAAAPITLPGTPPVQVPVTVSFGAAVQDPHAAPFPSAQVLVRAADRALYAAKEAGRNCVRLFRPRVGRAAA